MDFKDIKDIKDAKTTPNEKILRHLDDLISGHNTAGAHRRFATYESRMDDLTTAARAASEQVPHRMAQVFHATERCHLDQLVAKMRYALDYGRLGDEARRSERPELMMKYDAAKSALTEFREKAAPTPTKSRRGNNDAERLVQQAYDAVTGKGTRLWEERLETMHQSIDALLTTPSGVHQLSSQSYDNLVYTSVILEKNAYLERRASQQQGLGTLLTKAKEALGKAQNMRYAQQGAQKDASKAHAPIRRQIRVARWLRSYAHASALAASLFFGAVMGNATYENRHDAAPMKLNVHTMEEPRESFPLALSQTNVHSRYALVVEKDSQTATLYERSGPRGWKNVSRTQVSTGMSPGKKLHKSDGKTPEGVFYVTSVEDARQWVSPFDSSQSAARSKAAGSKTTGSYGDYFLRLSCGGWDNDGTYDPNARSAIGVHGTNEPRKLGTPASHGCVRMDTDVLDDMVAGGYLGIGTPIIITQSAYQTLVVNDAMKSEYVDAQMPTASWQAEQDTQNLQSDIQSIQSLQSIRNMLASTTFNYAASPSGQYGTAYKTQHSSNRENTGHEADGNSPAAFTHAQRIEPQGRQWKSPDNRWKRGLRWRSRIDNARALLASIWR